MPVSLQRLSCAGVLVEISGLVVKRSSGKRAQHRIITSTLNNHQCQLGLPLRELIDQPVEPLLRGNETTVPPTKI